MNKTSNFNNPTTSDNYISVLNEITAINSDIAKGLDPAVTNPDNIPTNAIRWNSANVFWEKFNGSVWGALASVYNIVVAQAIKLKTARNISVAGDLAGSVSFDGSSDVSITATLQNVNNGGGTVGSSTQVPVITWNAKGLITAVTNAVINIPTKLSQLTNDSGFITNVVTALGYTPYNATNPAGYITSQGSVAYATAAGTASNGGVTSVNGMTGNVSVPAYTKTSQLTNDSGFVASSGTISNANYANSAGNGVVGFTTYAYSGDGQAVRVTLQNGSYFDAITNYGTSGGG